MTTCNICCEKLNKSTRSLVECMHCQFSACRQCCQTFILNEDSVKCMNSECGKEWTRKFIRDSFTASFINGPLKEWRENLLVEREKALLPATQIYAEALYRIKEIDKELREIAQGKHVVFQGYYKEVELRIERQRLRREPTTLVAGGGVAADREERRQFMHPCSVDDCRGYLSTQWKCGLCATWACPECHEVIGRSKDTPHTCDPNTIETTRLLKKETKPCPKCAASIFKIDGCDQMWCTQCHTAFSWKTGNIETKIHNPHYYEWLRETQGSVPRDPLDRPVACVEGLEVGRDMMRQFEIILRDQHKNYAGVLHNLLTVFHNIIHLQNVEIRPENYERRNRDLRIKFLMQDIDESQFKKALQQADKRSSKQRDIQTVYEMVVDASSDILRRFLRYLMNTRTNERGEIDNSIFDEIRALSKYANDCLIDTQYVYGGEVLQFLPTLKLVDIYKVHSLAYNRMEFIRHNDYTEQANSPELDAVYKSTTNKYVRIWACWNHSMENSVIVKPHS